jgi:adenylate kinase family enzyme
VKRKIAMMGPSCSGKTTLAPRLADRLGVPHIELDALHHRPNWQEAPAEELRHEVEAALAGLDGWVADGNYMDKLGTWLIDQADTVVWLDLPLRVTLPRMWRRTTTRIRVGTELWDTGNRETWRTFIFSKDSLLFWEIRMHPARRREWPQLFRGRPLVRLRSAAEAEAWIAAQQP